MHFLKCTENSVFLSSTSWSKRKNLTILWEPYQQESAAAEKHNNMPSQKNIPPQPLMAYYMPSALSIALPTSAEGATEGHRQHQPKMKNPSAFQTIHFEVKIVLLPHLPVSAPDAGLQFEGLPRLLAHIALSSASGSF